MSTKTTVNLISTGLVALMLVLGSLFGYFILGGNHKDAAHASTIDGGSCVICTAHGGSGGNVPTSVSGVGGGGNR